MKKIGKISFFGGPADNGMGHCEHLALYWRHEDCDARPDLFFTRGSDPKEGTSKRLKNIQACYIALRFDSVKSRSAADVKKWRATLFRITNPKTQKSVVAHLVDWGPHEDTGRIVDASDAVGRFLDVATDDIVDVEELNYDAARF